MKRLGRISRMSTRGDRTRTVCFMDTKEACVMKKQHELVPPDGGYGYIVLVAATVIFISTGMFAVCFGMIFNDFFKELGMDSTDISLLTGINAMCVAVSGFLTGPMLKVMSMRKLAFIGSAFYNAGIFGTVFVKTQAQFIFCQGLLQSSGLGFLYNVSCSTLNDYFVSKRLLTVTFSQTVGAASAMLAPMVVTWSMEQFGFRGTLILISAVSVQTFVASALLQPVAWHMKKVEVADNVPESRSLMQTDNIVYEINNKLLQTPVIKLTDIETADSLFPDEKSDKPSFANGVLARVKSFLNWPLLKRFALTCGCYGAPVSIFADMMFVYFLAQALYDWQWDSEHVKWAFALLGFGDIAVRILMIFFSAWLNKVGSHLIYVIGLVVAIVTKLAMLWVRDYTSMLVIITVAGVSRCTVMILYPMVVSDAVSPEDFPSAMGISMMMFGIFSIIMAPIIGAIRDATGNYTTMFVILIGFMVAVTIAWTIELLHSWRRRKSSNEIN